MVTEVSIIALTLVFRTPEDTVVLHNVICAVEQKEQKEQKEAVEVGHLHPA